MKKNDTTLKGSVPAYEIPLGGNWKSLDFIDSDYAVSDTGKVWSNKTGTVLKQQCENGYMTIKLLKSGYSVHRLVAMCFVENPHNLATVNHIDRVRSNNDAGNLDWMTLEDNVTDAVAKNWKFRDPDGNVVTVYNLAKFCRDNNLTQRRMQYVHDGWMFRRGRWEEVNHHKGWTRYGPPGINPDNHKPRSRTVITEDIEMQLLAMRKSGIDSKVIISELGIAYKTFYKILEKHGGVENNKSQKVDYLSVTKEILERKDGGEKISKLIKEYPISSDKFYKTREEYGIGWKRK